ncbi:MAG: MT-A70 family methyltransferase [Cyanobacteria bacterium J06649_11]
MQLIEILNLPVPALAAHSGCVLWLWFTNNHILEAGKCIEHWGYNCSLKIWENLGIWAEIDASFTSDLQFIRPNSCPHV